MELIKEGAKENKPGAACSQKVVAQDLEESNRVPQRASIPSHQDRLDISEQMECTVRETA